MMRFSGGAILFGLLGACNDGTIFVPSCESVKPEWQASRLEDWTGRTLAEFLADLSGTYEVWWAPTVGEGTRCESSVPLQLQAEPAADNQMNFCSLTATHTEGYYLASDELSFVARCHLEGFGATPCSIQRVLPGRWALTSTSLGFELDEGIYLSLRWGRTGEFEYGSIRASDGSLLGRVCTAPQLPPVMTSAPPDSGPPDSGPPDSGPIAN